MIDDDDAVTGSVALEEIDLALLGARLEVACRRKFAKTSEAVAALDKELQKHGEKGNRGKTYYSYQKGQRRPRMKELQRIAQLFEVPVNFFLFGGYPAIDDAEVEIFRKHKAAKLSDWDSQDSSGTSPLPVNQPANQLEIITSHNAGWRSIVILTASEIRHINTGRGSLAQMSGQTLPVAGISSASQHSYAYILPEHDRSMIAERVLSFAPGTAIVADPERLIMPGDLVLADLQDYDHPLLRLYTASRPYAPGVAFELTAFNPSYKPIALSERDKVLGIARVISTTQRW